MRRAFGLAIVATLAGVVLQCASDPSIVGDGGVVDRWLSDLGIIDGVKGDGAGRDAGRDGRRFDSIGPKADAAPTSADWFTMTYKRNGGAADKLLAPGSDVSVSVGHVFDGGKLVPAVRLLSFGVPDESTFSRVSISVQLKGVTQPATVGLAGLTSATATESEATTAGTSKTLFYCFWAVTLSPADCQPTGTIAFTQVGTALVAGSYALTFVDKTGQKREASGQFEAVPYPEAAELKP